MEWASRVNWVDVIALIILLRFTATGSQKGFFGELFNILGLCLAIVLSIHFYAPISDLLAAYLFISKKIAPFIAFSLVTAAVLFVFVNFFAFMERAVKVQAAPLINKVGGPFLGFLKGCMTCTVMTFILLLMPLDYIVQSVKSKSVSAPVFIKMGSVLYEKSTVMFTQPKEEALKRLVSGVEPFRLGIMKEPGRKEKMGELLE